MEYHLSDMIDRLAEGQALQIGTDGRRVTAEERSLDQVAGELNRDPGRSSIVTMQWRPGGRYFASVLEHIHFKPLTPRGDLFEYRYVRWQEIPWVLITIPTADAHLFREVASQTGMRVSDGVPTIIDGKGHAQFPVRTVTLENGAMPGQPHHEATRQVMEALTKGEFDQAEAFRRIRDAEKEMYRWEEEALRKFYQDNNIPG